MVFTVLTLVGSIACVAQETPPKGETRANLVTVEPRKGSGVLAFKSTLLPDESFEFVTCEALVDGQREAVLFPIQLEPEGWKKDAESVGYTWTFPEQKARLDFRATPQGDNVLLEYTLTNESTESLKRVLIFPCMPSQGAPSFYPGTVEESGIGPAGRKARVGRNDYSELYARLFLWSKGERFSFKDSNLAADERHLAFMKKGESPLEWSWFVNGERTFDFPLLALASKDGEHVAAFALDTAIQASSNVGDGRACIHLVPYYREIEPGKSAKATGRFYLLSGKPEDVAARFRKDFPKLADK